MFAQLKLQRLASLTAAIGLLTCGLLAHAAPLVQQQNGIDFASGGVGQQETQALERIASRFNLKLVMTDTDGAYVSDATVRIRVPQGYTILDTRSNGPLFYARLSPGEYRVEADYNGSVKTRAVSIGTGGLQSVAFRWTADPGLSAVAPETLPATSTTTGITINPGPSPAAAASRNPQPQPSTAPTQAVRPAQPAGRSSRPEMKYAAGVAYLSGGVNADQQQRMLDSGDRYNLKIKFARTDDSLVFNVPTIITDAVGNEYLRGPAAGPWLYVNLPPGVYRIAVRDFDRSQRARVQIYDNQVKHITFTWSPNGQSASTSSRTQATAAPASGSRTVESAVSGAEVGIPVSTGGISRQPEPGRFDQPESATPAVQTYRNISYISGGTGESEEQAMRAVASRYNLHITLAQYDGDYLGEASVRVIAENNSHVLQADNVGPLLYTRLPPGNYAIVATHNGVDKRQEIRIPEARSKQVLFYW